jgi:hypothetical protein
MRVRVHEPWYDRQAMALEKLGPLPRGPRTHVDEPAAFDANVRPDHATLGVLSDDQSVRDHERRCHLARGHAAVTDGPE